MIGPYLSIIIPTYNRKKKLAKCLKALHKQKISQESYELIIVNDGSTDETKKFLEEEMNFHENLKALHQENSGQAKARNKALDIAQGQVILFIDDDIYTSEDFLKTHIEFHKKNPEITKSCLGLTLWTPDEKITPYMHWLTQGGHQFAYHKLKADQIVDYKHFYTSNISVKRDLIAEARFDTDFKGYGWEDIEFAYRLFKNKSLSIEYKPNALAYHDNFMDPYSLKKRMNSVGKSAKIFQKKHPELQIQAKGLKKLVLILITCWPSIFLLRLVALIDKRPLWYALTKRYFLEGLRHV
jgi:glycosyltransferase involved in cell wall biosynthesis